MWIADKRHPHTDPIRASLAFHHSTAPCRNYSSPSAPHRPARAPALKLDMFLHAPGARFVVSALTYYSTLELMRSHIFVSPTHMRMRRRGKSSAQRTRASAFRKLNAADQTYFIYKIRRTQQQQRSECAFATISEYFSRQRCAFVFRFVCVCVYIVSACWKMCSNPSERIHTESKRVNKGMNKKRVLLHCNAIVCNVCCHPQICFILWPATPARLNKYIMLS